LLSWPHFFSPAHGPPSLFTSSPGHPFPFFSRPSPVYFHLLWTPFIFFFWPPSKSPPGLYLNLF
jgi:hypothetical protein